MSNGDVKQAHQEGPEEIRALLVDLSLAMQQLPAAIAAAVRAGTTERRGAMREAGRELLTVLLPELSHAIGDEGFTASWLITHAQTDIKLRSALELAIGPLDRRAARRIGKLLRRAEHFILHDLHVERVGAVREGIVWSVKDTSRRFPPVRNMQTR